MICSYETLTWTQNISKPLDARAETRAWSHYKIQVINSKTQTCT